MEQIYAQNAQQCLAAGLDLCLDLLGRPIMRCPDLLAAMRGLTSKGESGKKSTGKRKGKEKGREENRLFSAWDAASGPIWS